MTAYDLPLDALRAYVPDRPAPADFDAFWRTTIDTARGVAAPSEFRLVETAFRTVTVEDVAFSGHGCQRIRAWFLAPTAATGRLPTVVEYVAYGGGRSQPGAWLAWPSAGYGLLVTDTRGQGSSWSTGDTPDLPSPDADPEAARETLGQVPGFVTRGIERKETWYYGRLVTDAVLAVDAARAHPRVDPDRIALAGISQGGGLALAVAGLRNDVQAALIDVPFLCDWPRAIEVTDGNPYHELTRYLAVRRDRVAQTLATVAYVDGIHFAPRARCPALFSVALRDETCPPSTVFAAYNRYAGPKDIRVWRYNGHEGGELVQFDERLRFLEGLGLAP
jgi:cephalosporin-C deacetylase